MGEKYADELSMKVAKYENMVYVGADGNARGFTSESDAKARGLEVQKLSGTKFRAALRSGEDVPDWFAFPAVVKTLQEGGDNIFVPGKGVRGCWIFQAIVKEPFLLFNFVTT